MSEDEISDTELPLEEDDDQSIDDEEPIAKEDILIDSDEIELEFNRQLMNHTIMSKLDVHCTTNIMTRYEFTKLKGFRMQQLASGSIPFVAGNFHSIEEIFHAEFREKKLPFIIKRQVSSIKYDFWRVKDLLYLDFPYRIYHPK